MEKGNYPPETSAEYLGKFPIKDPAHVTNLDAWEVPGLEIILPPRGSRPPVYAQKSVSGEWREILDRISPDARGDAATLIAAIYFFALRIESDLADRWYLRGNDQLAPVLHSVGRRLRNLLKLAYRRVTYQNSVA